jgi:hypothetical protein
MYWRQREISLNIRRVGGACTRRILVQAREESFAVRISAVGPRGGRSVVWIVPYNQSDGDGTSSVDSVSPNGKVLQIRSSQGIAWIETRELVSWWILESCRQTTH